MIQRFVVFATILFVHISAVKLEDFPEEYRELMPERVKSLIVGLSSQEQATMKEVYENLHTYKNDQEVVAAIRAKSPGLASKLEQFQSWWSEKAAGLGPEARAYFDAV
ncbi:hypothetical protein Y032_0005g2638 [Ancylostoma ceylanicum]|uniref:Nematode fatty acid retinoid binding protein n=1 Tax=Ancylostoma ceylanicum TaxID=53326 RepID=A0A016VS54_9BILA|nr:hypothetical protein Y032_0005g2638 [Ancylostoma ceylanicum]